MLDTSNLRLYHKFPRNFVEAIRASILLLNPLLVRFGYAINPLPESCPIEKRSMGEHFPGLTVLSVEVSIVGDDDTGKRVVARAPVGGFNGGE
jgi:UDP-N-acetylglucosamine 1-carboxyvinyltransferase